MNDRSRKLNSLFTNEAILTSYFGLYYYTRPVVCRSTLRL